PAPAIAERDRDCPLGGILPDDMLVELVNDFLGSHLGRHEDAMRGRSGGVFILPRVGSSSAAQKDLVKCDPGLVSTTRLTSRFNLPRSARSARSEEHTSELQSP